MPVRDAASISSGYDEGPHADMVVVEDRLDGGQRVGVAAESVGQHRASVGGEIGDLALTFGLRRRRGLLDQFTGRLALAAPRGEEQSAERQRRVARRGRGRAILVDHRGCLLEFTTQQQRPGEVVQCELQMDRGAGRPVELRLAQRQRIPGLGIPHFGGQGGAHLGAGDGQPAVELARVNVRGEQHLDRAIEQGCRGRIAIGESGDERIQQHVDGPRRLRARRTCGGGSSRCQDAAPVRTIRTCEPHRGVQCAQTRLTG